MPRQRPSPAVCTALLALMLAGCTMPKPEDLPGAKKNRDEATAEKGDFVI